MQENSNEKKISANRLMLTIDQAQYLLENIPGWKLIDEGKKIQRNYVFDNISQSLEFANSNGVLAEHHNHHPDLSLGR